MLEIQPNIPSIAKLFEGSKDNPEYGLFGPVIQHLNAKMVVELGTEHGISTRLIADAVEKTNGQFVTIDDEDRSEYVYGLRCVVLKGKSEDLGHNWNCPIDMLFVDTAPNGKHTYEQVSLELSIWAKFVIGCIMFHDIVSYPRVEEAVQDWLKVRGNEWTYEGYTQWPGMGLMWRVLNA